MSFYLILIMKIATYLALFSIGILATAFANSFQANGQNLASESQDATPIAAVTSITNTTEGKLVFSPSKITIKQGEEILILNNLTSAQTFTNGNGTGDPMDGKIFSVEIQPKSFAEYLSNLSPGNYQFYSKTDPTIKGELTVSK
jgi:plastocyanin